MRCIFDNNVGHIYHSCLYVGRYVQHVGSINKFSIMGAYCFSDMPNICSDMSVDLKQN